MNRLQSLAILLIILSSLIPYIPSHNTVTASSAGFEYEFFINNIYCGRTTEWELIFYPKENYSGYIYVSVGVDKWFTVSINPNPVYICWFIGKNLTKVTISCPSSTPPGNYTFTFTFTDGVSTLTENKTIRVIEPPTTTYPTFTTTRTVIITQTETVIQPITFTETTTVPITFTEIVTATHVINNTIVEKYTETRTETLTNTITKTDVVTSTVTETSFQTLKGTETKVQTTTVFKSVFESIEVVPAFAAVAIVAFIGSYFLLKRVHI